MSHQDVELVADYTNNNRLGSANDVSQREDLANFISMITRDETPFMSSIGKTKATAIYHEWQTDELQSPGNSRISEGTDYVIPGGTASALGAPTNSGIGTQTTGAEFAVVGPNRVRLGNYTQINGKTIAVSGTRRAIDQAGVADEYAYQLKKRGTELRRDLELDLIHSYNTSSATGARTMGGVQSWINDDDWIKRYRNWYCYNLMVLLLLLLQRVQVKLLQLLLLVTCSIISF